ncbi:MAG: hypothetical protein HY020_16085 [Burkholderiales bacterium]|nr:hypothetical protein [Burkholderiales bacterium]
MPPKKGKPRNGLSYGIRETRARSNELNATTSRLGDVRTLALHAVVQGGEFGEQIAAAVRGFEGDLPLDSEEERTDADKVKDLARTAQIWAQLGVKANYRAEPMADGNGYAVVVENPQAVGEDIDAMNARTSALAETLPLQNWTYEYFEHRRLPSSISLEQAMASAKTLDRPDLFSAGYIGSDPMHYRQGDVAGVAAVLLCEQYEDEVEWAVEVCLRALETPEGEREFFVPESILHNHPVQRAVQGLGAMLRFAVDADARSLEHILTEYVAHPYVRIGMDALIGLVGAWSARPEISLRALNLAFELSIIPVIGGPMGLAREDGRTRFVRIVEEALLRLEHPDAAQSAAPELPVLPPFWVPAPPKSSGHRHEDDADQDEDSPTHPGWIPNSLQVHANFLKDVLSAVPIDAALADAERREKFLTWCESLLRWTTDRQWPSWATERQLRDIRQSPRVIDYEWDLKLCRLIADVCLRLPVEEAASRLLQALLDACDEVFRSLGETVLRRIACAIADSSEISAVAIHLARRMVGRLVADEGWKDARRRGGGRGERALDGLVRDAFFDGLGHAALAARFANGHWDDVEAIFPVFEPLLAAHGTSLSVAISWVSLCEKSFDCYPERHFASNLKHLFPAAGQPGWAGSGVPARLAALIQRFSERTQPLPHEMAQECLRALDELIDLGDRRAAAVQTSEIFRSIRRTGH